MLLVEKDPKTVEQKAQKIKDEVEKMQLCCGDAAIKLQVSIGIAAKEQSDSVDCLLDKADKKLYQAKKSGKNRVMFRGSDAGKQTF